MKLTTIYLIAIFLFANIFDSGIRAQIIKCPYPNKCIDRPGSCDVLSEELSDCNDDPSLLFTPVCKIKLMYVRGTGFYKLITTNGIPNHLVGVFSSRTVSPCGRPDSLKEQAEKTYKIPPFSATGKYTYISIPETFGIAINGIPLDPGANEWYKCNDLTKWQKSALDHPDMQYDLDCNNAHVQPGGIYHYHGFPVGLYEKEGGIYPIVTTFSKNRKTILLGWAWDGAPVYGPECYRGNNSYLDNNNPVKINNWWLPKSGYVIKKKPTIRGSIIDPCVPLDAYKGYYDNDYEYKIDYIGDKMYLDECNGHFAPTPEYPKGIYHYHITLSYPYISRCFAGTPEFP